VYDWSTPASQPTASISYYATISGQADWRVRKQIAPAWPFL